MVEPEAVLRDLLRGPAAQGHAMELGVVTEDGLAVAGAADVKFKTVRAVLQREVERGDGVFRREKPRAPMTEKENAIRQVD